MDRDDIKYYSVMRNNKILSLVTTWMALECIMLSEINEITYIWYLIEMSSYKRRVDWWLPLWEVRDMG